MYETVVVPLDGSKRAEAILPHVVELAQRYGARVVFVRILEPIPYVMRPECVFQPSRPLVPGMSSTCRSEATLASVLYP